MFDNASLLVYTKDNNIFRIITDKDAQDFICSTFSDSYERLFKDKSKIIFDGKYRPEEDELLYINNFRIDDSILDAIRTPMNLETAKILGENIKFLFIGQRDESESSEQFKIVFQKFKSEQFIIPSKINLFFSNDTYKRDSRYGITINDYIDCLYDNGQLLFSSYYYTRQIFSLNEYYRSATDKDIDCFIGNEHLVFQSHEGFR